MLKLVYNVNEVNNIDKRGGLHWKKWEDLTKPKCMGGMRFRYFRLFNMAMLGKQG